MDLTLSSLGTLVAAAPCCVFYATKCQVYWRFDMDDINFASTLIWYHTYRQTHTGYTGTNRLKHINKHILTPSAAPVTLASRITLNKYLSDTNIYFTEVDNVFAFQKLLNCRLDSKTLCQHYVLPVKYKEYW